MKKTVYCLCLLLIFACKPMLDSEYYLKKNLSYNNFKLKFTVSEDDVNTVRLKKYTWYKAQQIHESVGGYSGALLHGEFTKYYLSNQLAEQGVFKMGLKNGVWKSWYENGELKSIDSWKNGIRNGVQFLFNDKGEIVSKGRYARNLKEGDWVNYETKDTIRYKKGKEKLEKIEAKSTNDSTKVPFFKRIFKKKNKKKS